MMKSAEHSHFSTESTSPRRWVNTFRHSLTSLSLLKGSAKASSGFVGDWRRRRRWMESPSPSLAQLLDGCDRPCSLPLRVRVVETERDTYEGISPGSLLTLLEFDEDVVLRFECTDDSVLYQAVTPGSKWTSLAGLPSTLFKLLPPLEEHDGKAFTSPRAVLDCRPVPEQVRALSGYSLLDDIGVEDIVEPGDVFVVGTGTCFKNGLECAIWFRLVANDRRPPNEAEPEHRRPQMHREPILLPLEADIEFETTVDDDLYTLRELVDLIKCRYVELPLRVRLTSGKNPNKEFCQLGGQQRAFGEKITAVGWKRRRCVVMANDSEIFRLPCEEWPALFVSEVAVDTKALGQVLRATLAHVDTVQLRTLGSIYASPQSWISDYSSKRHSTLSTWSNGNLPTGPPSPLRQEFGEGNSPSQPPDLPPRPSTVPLKETSDSFADYSELDPKPKSAKKTSPVYRNIYGDANQRRNFSSEAKGSPEFPEVFHEKPQTSEEDAYEKIERKTAKTSPGVGRKETSTVRQHEMLTRELSHSPRKKGQVIQRTGSPPLGSSSTMCGSSSSNSGEEKTPTSPSPLRAVAIGNYDVPRVTSPARQVRISCSNDQRTPSPTSKVFGAVTQAHHAPSNKMAGPAQPLAAAVGLSMMGSHWRQRCESLRLQLADAQRELENAQEEICRLKKERQQLIEKEAARSRPSPGKIYPVYEYQIPRSRPQPVNDLLKTGLIPIRREVHATS